MIADLTINGRKFETDIRPGEMLIDTLRALGFKSVKHGCDSADCGTCTVLLDGKAILSCSTFTASASGKQITTVEGLGSKDSMDRIQQVFAEESAFQCGFCAPGLIMATKEILNKFESLDEDEIKYHLSGNLCRCTGYEAQVKAVKRMFGEKNQKSELSREGDSDE